MDTQLTFLLPSCDRCGIPCKSGIPRSKGARLLSKAERGLCPDCAVTEFLLGVETVRYGIEKNGLETLLWEPIQRQFAAVMLAGNADMQPNEIDWARVVELWDLPFPRRRE